MADVKHSRLLKQMATSLAEIIHYCKIIGRKVKLLARYPNIKFRYLKKNLSSSENHFYKNGETEECLDLKIKKLVTNGFSNRHSLLAQGEEQMKQAIVVNRGRFYSSQ